MPISASVGQASAIDGREASAQAVRRALKKSSREQAALAFVFASNEYPIQEVLNGIAPVLGNTPLIGASSSHELTWDGPHQRSVVVALLFGDTLESQAAWWPGFAEDSRPASDEFAGLLADWDHPPGSLVFVTADGFGGDTSALCARLSHGSYTLSGGLAGGSVLSGRTHQIGGAQAGHGGLAAAWVKGGLRCGLGYGHGWQPIGSFFEATRSDGLWLRTLNDTSVAETYSHLFGHRPRDWAFPPLNELVRLYPLGIESKTDAEQVIHSPLRMEADGSLRMNKPVPQGSICHLLVGSPETCEDAARKAAEDALRSLDGARAVLAIALVDVAWQILFEGQPWRPFQALREVLSPDIPLAGAYTFGQTVRAPGDSAATLLNQHITLLLIGEA
jgi:hypothetical protein